MIDEPLAKVSTLIELLEKQRTKHNDPNIHRILNSISRNICSVERSTGPRMISKLDNRHFKRVPSVDDFNIISDFGLKLTLIHRNLSFPELYEKALKEERGTFITRTGALATLSGKKTGRSPKDKRIVSHDRNVWSGDNSPNILSDAQTFLINRERAVDFLNTKDYLYVVDGYAGWDVQHRIKIRIICTRAYHALFMNNMLIRPSMEELENFGEPDWTIINSGQFPCNRMNKGMTSSTTISLNLDLQQVVILGTQYAGEMKKGIFSIMHYLMPKRGVLSLHSSANEDPVTGETAVFFGLSGTGKTTLSADPKRNLIGDDEHCWSDEGIFNIEGGCYAKCINLSQESEPEIFSAIKFGTVLENVVFNDYTRYVDYTDNSITENTRASYPIDYISNAKIPCVGGHPKNLIFLTCDASGVLPPVSILTETQAMYHFISGYTSKMAGTEMGITQPQATFSACFGEAFIIYHPLVYAKMLSQKMQKHHTKAWLVNTGWIGGEYGVGKRISLKYTRKIIDEIHKGSIDLESTGTLPHFNLQIPKKMNGIPEDVLLPWMSWTDRKIYDVALQGLAQQFDSNFKKYEISDVELTGQIDI